MSGLERTRTALRWVIAAAYLFVGIVHLRSPNGFMPIVPDWVPYPLETILLTGVCEIAGAIGLMTKRFRRAAAWGLAAYAVCVYPANIKHAVEGVIIGGTQLGWGYHAPRLAFQPVLVWWALFAGGITSWPFGRKGPAR
ncbi:MULTISPECIES: DoxX family protein [unclassified Sphingomonas]|uniref:DoxX family protein n=1 Tax=unclassified Sphingomonas TaxID=196159 RepID=UPI000BCFC90F|nr:MAG: hypothetical protein B7Z43_03885 [Sphingomonas sp. 12-62-6]OYX38858.1 MAG: hypothetical protein B7Y98_06985 [Sphingomonas sp. 32-62-10]